MRMNVLVFAAHYGSLFIFLLLIGLSKVDILKSKLQSN